MITAEKYLVASDYFMFKVVVRIHLTVFSGVD